MDIPFLSKANPDIDEEISRCMMENIKNGFAYCRIINEPGKPIDWVNIKVNKAYYEISGLKDVEGRRFNEVLPGFSETNKDIADMYHRVSQTGNPQIFESYVPSLGKWYAISASSCRKDYFLAIFDDITARKNSEQALKQAEEKYYLLFHKMINGFSFHQIVTDDTGKPVDYVFLEVNEAFEHQTGLKSKDIIGKKVTAVIQGIEKDPADWIGRYGQVALTGKEIRFEQYSNALDRHYSVLAYSPKKGFFATIFEDITDRKRIDEDIRSKKEELEKINSMMIGRELRMVELKNRIAELESKADSLRQ